MSKTIWTYGHLAGAVRWGSEVRTEKFGDLLPMMDAPDLEREISMPRVLEMYRGNASARLMQAQPETGL